MELKYIDVEKQNTYTNNSKHQCIACGRGSFCTSD